MRAITRDFPSVTVLPIKAGFVSGISKMYSFQNFSVFDEQIDARQWRAVCMNAGEKSRL